MACRNAVNFRVTDVEGSTMNQYDQQLVESLSALMDGEATDLETRRLLSVLSSSENPQAQLLREKWQRYQAASSSISGGDVSTVDVSSSISLAIEQEDRFLETPLKKILGVSGRFAVAASAALVAILGVQQFNQPLNLTDETSSFALLDEAPLDNYAGPVNLYPANSFLPENTQVQAVSSERYSEKEVRRYLSYILNEHSLIAPYVNSQEILSSAPMEQRGPAKPAE